MFNVPGSIIERKTNENKPYGHLGNRVNIINTEYGGKWNGRVTIFLFLDNAYSRIIIIGNIYFYRGVFVEHATKTKCVSSVRQ